ncbi:MAG: FeoB small GTPase domain-containing protein [Acidilobaceae archaeon]
MSETSKLVRVALAGVPNAGKTLIFNLITGARARVSNWPGTTVEKRVGYRWHRGYRLEVVDLPGAYSLTAWSPEQEVAARFLVEEKPDVVVAVFDATNLEKSVYLALQLLEAGHKLVVALNKIDLAEGLGVEVDHWELSRLLSCPVVPMVATKALGLRELLDAIIDAYERGEKPAPPRYSGLAGELVEKLEAAVKSEESLGSLSSRRLAVGLLENDPYSLSVVEKTGASRVKRELEEARLECGGDCSLVVSKARLDLASSIASRVEKRRAAPLRRLSDLVDAAVLDKHLAVPVLLTVFWALFVFAFRASEPLVELADSAVASLSQRALCRCS